MKLFFSILSLIIVLSSKGQEYSYAQIEEKVHQVVQDRMGRDLSELVEINEITLTYKGFWGNPKLKGLQPNESIKSSKLITVSAFVCISGFYDLLDTCTVHFSIDLDQHLAPKDTSELQRIPTFIQEDRSCDWLSAQERSELIDTLKFDQKVLPINQSVVFDETLKEYLMMLVSSYERDNGHHLDEIYLLDIVSGEEVDHFFYEQ